MDDTAPPQRGPAFTVYQALQQAVSHHQAGQLQEAERLYRDILRVFPNHPNANHNLGVLAGQVKQPAAGLPYLRAALETNPNHVQNWLSYIDALIQSGQTDAARAMLEQGRQRGLQEEALQALGRRIGPSRQELNAVIALFAKGSYSEAESLAMAMTDEFPEYGPGWSVMGAVLKQMGRNAEALAPMQKAVSLLPNDPVAHSNLGVTLHDLERPVEAETSLRHALRLKPGFAEAHNNLGNTLKALGRLEEALDSYQEALRHNADCAEAHHNLGVTLIDLGRLDEAEASIRQALLIRPDYAEAHSSLANTLLGRGNPAEAEASCRRALELKQDLVEPHNLLSLALEEQGRLEEAVASSLRALDLKPDSAVAHYALGNLFADLGESDAAASHFQTCCALDPDDSLGARLLLARMGRGPMPTRMPGAQLNSLYAKKSRVWDQGKAYCGHQLVVQALSRLEHDAKGLDILDAGCGTGLVGVLVRHMAKRLDGVDMSVTMLQKAKAKGIYDLIHHGDMVPFMATNPHRYDVITCAATLIHFGDLSPVFDAAATTLKENGSFVFTLFPNGSDLEVTPAPIVALARNGCYGHSERYVRRIAAAAGFVVEIFDSKVHEYHDETVPVMGLVVALRRHPRVKS